ncbi:hypothetical protein EsH8_VII_000363 [Colletotrichum jinshuiense]
MKSTILLPAFLATAIAATIPEAAQAIVVPDTTLDAAIAEPLVNYVESNVAGSDPADFLSFEDDSATQNLQSDEDAGELAWAAIHIEALEGLETVEEMRDERPAPPVVRVPKDQGRPARPGKNDFHLGITKDQLCTYFHGIAWKTEDLKRPVYQWTYEYVPWLIQNKGPYIYVLDGLREIEWALWKIERALQYTSPFTENEERAIVRCYYAFSGYERQITVRPGTRPAPLAQPLLLSAPPASLPTFQPATPAAAPKATIAPRDMDRPFPKPFPRPLPFPFPWRRDNTSVKKLLRLITAKAPVSKYQSYANHRIHNVLLNLDRSTLGAVNGLINKFQTNEAKEYLVYDIKQGQGINKALDDAIKAYEVK